ncbi:MAG: ATP-binding protein [Leptospiraceae bacterium]|nr:ATP-binding protein [Leptospiraceae bacterium]
MTPKEKLLHSSITLFMEQPMQKLSMTLDSDWENVNLVRREIKSFLQEKEYLEEDIYALQMVSAELLENAIKYGNFELDKKIQYNLNLKKSKVIVEVTNPVRDSDNLKKLDQQIQWIRGYQNPFEAYVEKVKEISSRSHQDRESGLGLVRIAYEGHSILDFYVNEENVLAISAVYEN